MNHDFTSIENKTLLWDLLKDTKLFINLASVSKREDIIEMFEAQISEVSGTSNASTTLLKELNMQFLDKMFVSLKQQVVKPVASQSLSLSQDVKTDMQQQRASQFEERLKKKQDEFYQQSTPPPPKISFKDNDEAPINISAHLEHMQMSRVADLEQVTFTTNQNWDFSSMKPDNDAVTDNPRPQLKIDHTTDVSNSVDAVINKKVSWSDKDDGDKLNNFMDRLKQKKEEVNSTLLSQIQLDLREIKNIQYQILDKMNDQKSIKTPETPQYNSLV